MDRFRELSALSAVAEAGSFSAAARRLGVSPPAATRLIAALEARLGVRLLTRTTRRVALTEAGARLHADAARILGELEAAEAAATGAALEPRGTLRITAPVLFGQRFLAPVLRDFLDSHPQLRAELLLLDRPVDLVEEGLDVALRIGRLPDSTLRATRIGDVRRVVVAAPSYLERHGAPGRPDDLAGHRIVFGAASDAPPLWEFVGAKGRRTIRLQPALAVTALQAALEAAEDGWAITRLLSYQVADALRAGRLVELLPGADTERMPVHLLHAEAGRPAAKTRAFVDFAAGALRARATHVLAI